ncbi:uncharacterized protein BROUX77_002677 [Berkeleyomyces rouxiae]|uniref:uncharacterized protein n=1 Tax=Berkeleyomyces rouxiae TaxID=2035830 RepID=UPI003B7AE99E
MALTREMIEHLNTFLLSIPDRTPENWHLGALPREFSAEIKMAIVAAYMSGLRTDDGAPPIPVGSVPDAAQVYWAAFQAGAEARFNSLESLPRVKREEDADPLKEADKHLDVVPYDGNQQGFQAFQRQLAVKFAAAPKHHRTEQRKLMTAFSYLRDGALDWAMPRMDPATGHMNFETYDDFMKSLAEAFDDPDWRMTATQQIFDLKQTGTCTAYHYAFTTLLKKLGWADADFTIALFQRGLKPHIQDALAWNTYPAPKGTLDQFANFCNTLDNTINNRTRGNNGKIQPPPGVVPFQQDSRSRNAGAQKAVPNTKPAKGTPAGPDANGLPFRKTADGKMAKGVCWKCGAKDHMLKACPKNNLALRAATVPSPSTSTRAPSTAPAPDASKN